jgi:anti-anti-sigma regulatory factor
MPVNVELKKVGEVVILYPEGHLQGIASGPVRNAVEKNLEQDVRKFIINFKNVVSIDYSYANALNSIFKEVVRSDGKIMLSDAGIDVLPYLEKNAPDVPLYKTEDIALTKLTGKTSDALLQVREGNVVVVGGGNVAGELFKGIVNYKGLTFHYFEYSDKSVEKIIALNPQAILLNLESGSQISQAVRRWRFEKLTRECPIILFGPPSSKPLAPILMKEGASDFIEVKFEHGEVLAYLKPLDFRNVLAKKLDMVLSGVYDEIINNG